MDDKVALDLAVSEAFGECDESLVRTISKAEFSPGVKVGARLQGPGANWQPVLCHVVKIEGTASAP